MKEVELEVEQNQKNYNELYLQIEVQKYKSNYKEYNFIIIMTKIFKLIEKRGNSINISDKKKNYKKYRHFIKITWIKIPRKRRMLSLRVEKG